MLINGATLVCALFDICCGPKMPRLPKDTSPTLELINYVEVMAFSRGI